MCPTLLVWVLEPGDAGAIGDQGEGETGIADATMGALLASGSAMLVAVPPAMTPSPGLHVER